MKPRMHPGRFFRRNPGWLLAARLAMFAGLFQFMAWLAIDLGEWRSRRGTIARADSPELFWTLVALVVGSGLFVTTASTIIYLKKKRLVAKKWKLLGMDFRV